MHNNAIAAVDALLKVHSTYKMGLLRETLSLLTEAWHGDHRAYRAMCLLGTAAFLARYYTHPNYNRRRLVTRMTKDGIPALERRANSIKEAILATNPNNAWGQALLTLHNFRVPEGNELPEWPKRHITEEVAAQRAARMKSMNDLLTPEDHKARSNKAMKTLGHEALSQKAIRAAVSRRGYSARNVPCPLCKADSGKPCRTSGNNELPNVHKARRKLALHMNQEQKKEVKP